MKKLTLIALVTLAAANINAEESVPWTIGERTLPAPQAASEELQTALNTLPQPNPAQFNTQHPKTVEEWEKITIPHNASRSAMVKQAAPAMGVTITERSVGDAMFRKVQPKAVAEKFKNNVFVHMHSGGYTLNAGLAGTPEAVLIAARLQIPVIAIDYRMPPQDPFPAAVDDVVAIYQNVLESYKPEEIGFGGSSAGGGLALSAIHRFKQENIPLPAAVFAGSPWADLTKTSDSLYALEGIDRGVVTYDGVLAASAKAYANGESLTHSLISPLYGDFTNFPPTQLVTGTRDLFLSDSARTHRAMKRAGVAAELNVYEGISHVGYLLSFTSPEAVEVFSDLGSFLNEHLK
ncbi:MAG: alpha/beta hydrolase fold domain-containing protein [Pseudomonadota bacterium]